MQTLREKKFVPLLDEQWHFPNDYTLKQIYLIPLKDSIENYDFLIVETLGWGEGDTAILSTKFPNNYDSGHGAFLSEGYEDNFTGYYNATIKVSTTLQTPNNIRATLLFKGNGRAIEQVGINQVYGVKL